MKDANGKVLVENDQVKEEWRKYMENCWMRRTHGIMPQPMKCRGTCELIRRDEI